MANGARLCLFEMLGGNLQLSRLIWAENEHVRVLVLVQV